MVVGGWLVWEGGVSTEFEDEGHLTPRRALVRLRGLPT